MFKNDFNLADAFESTGTWWLPEKPETKVRGTLKYSPTEVNLTVDGELTPRAAMPGSDDDRSDRFKCVHGVMDDGRSCTLLNGLLVQRRFNLRTTPRCTYSAVFFVVGAHAPEYLDFTLPAVAFTCSMLDIFLRRRLVDSDFHESGDAWLRYKHPPAIQARIETLSTDLAISPHVVFGGSGNTTTMTVITQIVFVPSGPKTLDWFIQQIWRFCDLLTLLTDEPTFPTCLRFSRKPAEDGWVLYRAGREQDAIDENAALSLFYYEHLQANFPKLVCDWFAMNDQLVLATRLFREAHREITGAATSRFLFVCHAVEVFSRATTSSLYLPPEQYEAIKKALVDAIPNGIDTDHRRSLSTRIEYGNEYSLRKRIHQLLKSLSNDCLECVCHNPKSFVSGIVDTRNYFTHYTEKLKPLAFQGIDLYWGCERLLMLLRILLAKQIGIPEQQIAASLKRHPWLADKIRRYKQVPECAEAS